MEVLSINITYDLKKGAFLVYQIALVAPFKEGPSSLMSTIEKRGITRPQALHYLTYISPMGLYYKEANLTADQKIIINPEFKSTLVTAQELKKRRLACWSRNRGCRLFARTTK